jgi:hypothetical protein
VRRASTVELVLDKASEGRLKIFCTLAAKLWNEGLNKVFNGDLVGAYNILVTPITPSPPWGRGNRAGDPARGYLLLP